MCPYARGQNTQYLRLAERKRSLRAQTRSREEEAEEQKPLVLEKARQTDVKPVPGAEGSGIALRFVGAELLKAMEETPEEVQLP